MNLLRYRPPLVTYRVVKARKMTPYQAQYLARKSYGLGRGSRGLSGRRVILPVASRVAEGVALVGLALAGLVVLVMLALLILIGVGLVWAILA